MKIISKAFEDNGKIPQKYTCEGEGINPPFEFIDVPNNTVALVLLAWDPDVPLNIRDDGNWDHWIVFNMSPNITEIKEGIEPEGDHGLTTSETYKYVPPCPPDREHRYYFKLYAIDTKLSMSQKPVREEVQKIIKKHIIEESQIIGTYCKDINR